MVNFLAPRLSPEYNFPDRHFRNFLVFNFPSLRSLFSTERKGSKHLKIKLLRILVGIEPTTSKPLSNHYSIIIPIAEGLSICRHGLRVAAFRYYGQVTF